ncbi:MAG: 50S ribosomal protein L25 [Candidatus Uhrbacteria bacterium]|nr:50S ribosomal protein L25 [Candidatus Uhrbacteria bacterium]
MQHATLNAVLRIIVGRKTDALRVEGKVPAIVYGFGIEPTSITVDRNEFIRVFSASGSSTVVDLMVDGAKHPVLIGDVQRDPLTNFVTHIDFRRVDATRKIEAKIPLKLVGIPAAVKELGGTLLQSLEDLEVKSLPDALVSHIDVDVMKLATFEDVIRVSDLVVPEGIEVITDADMPIASVQAPRSEEEMAALDTAIEVDVSKVEVTTEKKEEATAEGDAKAAAAKGKE